MNFLSLAQECAPWVAPQTMAAIVKTESAFRPLAIGVNGGAKLARQPENKEEAVVTAKWLISNGYSVDLGLGQVNSFNLPKIGLSIDDAFDPCKNVAAAARILQGYYQVARGRAGGEQAALYAALSAYNTGSFSKGFINGYVRKVVGNTGAFVGSHAVPAVMPIPLANAKPRTSVRVPQAPSAEKAESRIEDRAGATVERMDVDVNVYGTNTKGLLVY